MIRRLGVFVVFQVTGGAIRAQPLELAHRSVFMAGLAIGNRMCPKKGESVRVVLHTCLIDTPPEHRMALLTVASHLAAVKIRMTIGALAADSFKFKTGVTSTAIHACVHAPERTTCFRVRKIRKRPERRECRGRVTGSACLPEHPMRRTSGRRHFILHCTGIRPRDQMHFVTLDAKIVCGIGSQGSMRLNLWVPRSIDMAIEAFEFRLGLKEIMAVRTMFRAAQNRMTLHQGDGFWLRMNG